MAEINMPDKKGKKRKIHSTRIDSTPMVDLGFLLITFFIITTTMAKPKTMELNMPSDRDDHNPTKVIAESTLTLIPTKNHMVAYYEGILTDTAQLKICSTSNVRDVIIKKKK